jgi:P-type Ca2+ transporter type 2C
VELGMLQRPLDTESPSGRQWLVVLGLSLLAPAVVAVDKFIQLSRQRKAQANPSPEIMASPQIIAGPGLLG